ncbi:MAG: serine/threonine-protein kinase, partial [Myxococcales bacterium]|nr:serine/threonine-protein kinase [Myxococcales bacterium]
MSAQGDNQADWSADELIPFGKYMLLDRLSSGATASVYRANVRGEAGFERVVAIKRILPHMAGDPAFVKTFVTEAKTTARLTHANICPIYELGKVGESLYMAVEYVAGKDLGRIRRALEKKGQIMPAVTAAWIAARLCDALDYAHNLKNMAGERIGIVHRDLSPTNIVLSYEGQVKLIDFGLAKAVGKSQQTNVDALKKKLSYMSPEMVKGRAPDARSDIFGVGICLYEMLTGRKLFAGENDIDTLKQVGLATVPPPSAVMDDAPEDLELILMRALEREPDDRWQDAAEMGEALNGFLQKTAPTFGINQLSAWMYELFGDEIEGEQSSFRHLINASNDPEVVKARRAFFSSPDGAAARARAEVERRLSSGPPRDVVVGQPVQLKPAPVPADIKPIADELEPAEFEDEPTEFYEGEDGGEFEDEPTQFMGDGPSDDEPFADEPTQALDEADVELLGHGVVAQPFDFEEEPTEIFFNKEDGIGVPNLLEEIGDVQEAPAPLNRPIVAPELQVPAPAVSSAPPAPSAPPPQASIPAPPPPSVPAPEV